LLYNVRNVYSAAPIARSQSGRTFLEASDFKVSAILVLPRDEPQGHLRGS
jgi:hypothetical protein